MPNYRFSYPVSGTFVTCCDTEHGKTFRVSAFFEARDDAHAVEVAKMTPEIRQYHLQMSYCSLVRIDEPERASSVSLF